MSLSPAPPLGGPLHWRAVLDAGTLALIAALPATRRPGIGACLPCAPCPLLHTDLRPFSEGPGPSLSHGLFPLLTPKRGCREPTPPLHMPLADSAALGSR